MGCALLLSVSLLAADPGSAGAPKGDQDYEAARAAAGRDPKAHIQLALWCEAHGLKVERLRHLAIAILSDPANATARGLLGYVSDGGRWRRADEVVRRGQADEALAANLAEYNAQRAKTSHTAEAQWKLAVWCEERGLKAEAAAHLTNVVRLDPGRSAAWKRLGYKRVRAGWMTPEQIAQAKAERKAQAEADRHWTIRLTKIQSALRSKQADRRAEAEQALASLSDPRAVPAICYVFGAGDAADQQRAVQLLGQLDTLPSSRALALLAVGGADDEVRRAATETLTKRDPRDYMGPLIAGLRDLLKYQVKPVGGPGSPGVLFVEGERFNRELIYAPPPVNYNSGGMTVAPSWGYNPFTGWGPQDIHLAGTMSTTTYSSGAAFTGAEFRHGLANPNDPRAGAFAAIGGGNPAVAQSMAADLFKHQFRSSSLVNSVQDNYFDVVDERGTTTTRATDTVIPARQNYLEFQKAAAVAQQQLQDDIAVVERMNRAIKESNDRVLEVLNNVSGQSLGVDRQAWNAWWADKQGYAYVPEPDAPKPTVVETVLPAYTPQLQGPSTTVGKTLSVKTTDTPFAVLTNAGAAHYAKMGLYWDCFAAGTPVQTRSGPRPIEKLAVGDQVLSQDPETGALEFRPILTVFHYRQPTPTIRLTLKDDTLLTTPVHWFWRPGKGWLMARDLKPGDTLRTLGGTSEIASIAPDDIRPVFNLEIAGNATFFVGKAAVLAHDNTPTGRRGTGFDLARAAEETTGDRR
jgi:hypothetical protein